MSPPLTRTKMYAFIPFVELSYQTAVVIGVHHASDLRKSVSDSFEAPNTADTCFQLSRFGGRLSTTSTSFYILSAAAPDTGPERGTSVVE